MAVPKLNLVFVVVSISIVTLVSVVNKFYSHLYILKENFQFEVLLLTQPSSLINFQNPKTASTTLDEVGVPLVKNMGSLVIGCLFARKVHALLVLLYSFIIILIS